MEARIQSARAASEAHKRRTGKGLKITEEIVRREEMYEEEDDDIPRPYRALAAHLHTSVPGMDNRTSAYVTSQMAAALYAREAEVSREFAKHFPHAPLVSRQLQGMHAQSLPKGPAPTPHSYQPSLHLGSPPPMGYHTHHRSQSIPQMAPQPQIFAQFDHQSPMPGQNETFDDASPVLTPSSDTTGTPNSSCTPTMFYADNFSSRGQPTRTLPVEPSFSESNGNFLPSFTSEIPNNMKAIADLDSVDPLKSFYVGFASDELAEPHAAMFGPPQIGEDPNAPELWENWIADVDEGEPQKN